MTAEYDMLETSRKQLKRKLSRLNHELWEQTFPKEMAKEFNEIMLNAYKLVNNPDQLGAFSSVKGIKDEIGRVRFADKSLDGVNTSIAALKEKSGEQTVLAKS